MNIKRNGFSFGIYDGDDLIASTPSHGSTDVIIDCLMQAEPESLERLKKLQLMASADEMYEALQNVVTEYSAILDYAENLGTLEADMAPTIAYTEGMLNGLKAKMEIGE